MNKGIATILMIIAFSLFTACSATTISYNSSANSEENIGNSELLSPASTAASESPSTFNESNSDEFSSEFSSSAAPTYFLPKNNNGTQSSNESELPTASNTSSYYPYTDILNAYRRAICEHSQNDPQWSSSAAGLVSSIVNPYWAWENPSDLLSKTGFAIFDLDSDGTNELLLGWIGAPDQNIDDGYFFAVYTTIDGQATLALEGWERNIYFLGADSYIYNRGSSGVSSSSATKNSFSIATPGYLLPLEIIYTQRSGNGIRWEYLSDSSKIPSIDTDIPHENLLIDEEFANSTLASWFSHGTALQYQSFSEYQ